MVPCMALRCWYFINILIFCFFLLQVVSQVLRSSSTQNSERKQVARKIVTPKFCLCLNSGEIALFWEANIGQNFLHLDTFGMCLWMFSCFHNILFDLRFIFSIDHFFLKELKFLYVDPRFASSRRSVSWSNLIFCHETFKFVIVWKNLFRLRNWKFCHGSTTPLW